MHLLEVDGRQVLLDCGLTMERRSEGGKRNRIFPFDPYGVHAVVLSHAHIDHCGNLPNLVKQGFRGPVYCTPATADLIRLMLLDSARIQEEDALHLNIGRTNGAGWVEPIYTRADVTRTLELCEPLPYEEPREILKGVTLELVDAGHVLGSATVALTVVWGGREVRLTFSGDRGRPGMPLLRQPAPLPPADVLVCESTYGGQTHEPVAVMIEALRVIVNQTIQRGGKVLIPAFSLGRAQIVVHCLQELLRKKQIPAVPVFVDSPLASAVTEIYRDHPECLTEEVVRQLTEPGNFLGGPLLHYVRTVDESKLLNARRDPCIIVASSGMGEGGRILHHLKHNVDDPRCTVVLVSFQAPDTLGSRLLERRPTVRFLGREWNKWADVVVLKGFSGHADHNDLVNSVAPLVGRATKVRLVHGEVEQSEALARSLREHGFADVDIPEAGTALSLL
jgi:metallo-beta-lactamase family protein